MLSNLQCPLLIGAEDELEPNVVLSTRKEEKCLVLCVLFVMSQCNVTVSTKGVDKT